MGPQLVAHLAHVEVLEPDPAETIHRLVAGRSLAFVAARGPSTYLRGSADAMGYSLKITQAPQAGVGHVAWRAAGPCALRRAVAVLAASGRGLGWVDGDVGHGPAYRFQAPSGHVHELLWEVELARPGAPTLPTGLVRLDHVALACALAPEHDAAVLCALLGFRRVAGPAGVALSAAGGTCEVALVADPDGSGRGGLHHVGMRLARHLIGPPASGALRIQATTTVSPAFP
jgi:catechol 2,3-dioxygenase